MKKSVLYLHIWASPFVQKDIDLLSEECEVITRNISWTPNSRLPFAFLSQAWFILQNISKVDALFVMFGGYWAFWPVVFGRLFGKPVYIILGGTDCVSFPSLNYGSLRKPFLRRLIGYCYARASRLLPVSQTLVHQAYSYHQPSDSAFQGYQHYFPKVQTEYTVIHNGYDAAVFEKPSLPKQKNSFITVASISDQTRYELKGIDRFVHLAKHFPDYSFTVVGMSDKFRQTKTDLPPNLTIHSFMKQNDFKQLVQRSEFYVQLSVSEGFPNALCEGMLSECIPIGSSVGAIREIIGDTGFVMESSDFAYLESSFESILQLDDTERLERGRKARLKIQQDYPIEKRKQAFLKLLES